MSHRHDEDEEDMVIHREPLEGVSVHVIPLDGTLSSALRWEKEEKASFEKIERGANVVFDLDLGLFERLPHPLSHEGQFQTLKRSCAYFREYVARFSSPNILGVILHKRILLKESATDEMSWNQRRRIFEQEIDMLRKLSLEIPDTFYRFCLFHAEPSCSASDVAISTAKDLLDPLDVALSSDNIKFITPHLFAFHSEGDTLAFSHRTSSSSHEAILLPEHTSISWQDSLTLRQIITPTTRLVHASFLTDEWTDLETLSILRKNLSKETERSLRGFAAAGGSIVEL